MSYKIIPLGEIGPNPTNPRKKFAGPAFEELKASIKEKGVIEPIIVRPANKLNPPYEVVAGSRRLRAAAELGLKLIPAVVRELNDDEAYDFMLIENLQREDLTELEEAESFKAWAGRHKGENSIKELAEKTGIRPAYVRARIAVLALGPKVLEAWKKGDLTFSHLEQLLRLPNAEAQREMVDRVKSHDMSALALRKEISGRQVSLGAALFDTRSCIGCRHNSTVQKELFGFGDAKAACQHPKCFKGKQGEWLKHHWLETPQAKKYKTRSARFDADFNWDSKREFSNGEHMPNKCLECEDFVSLVTIEGRIESGYGQGDARVCIGDRKCFNSAQQSARAAERTTDREKKKESVDAGKQARVTWHGEYFRNVFFKRRIPEVLASLKPEDEKIKTLLIMCLAYANSSARSALRNKLGFRDAFGDNTPMFKKLLEQSYEKIVPLFREAVKEVLLEGQNVSEGNWNSFGSSSRRLVAEFLNIDLSKEWAADEEYLKKKTRKELLAFGRKVKILTDPLARKFMAEKLKAKSPDPEKLKKSELVDVFLKSGVDLVGRVPDEITKV
jgi:ParB/RepB/Spo0J family partition protein